MLEIQRQNLITQKILQRYLERRLHPERKPQIHVPSVDEILAKSLANGSVRDTRTSQNESMSSGQGSSSSSSSRYSLFDEYSGGQLDSETGEDPTEEEFDRDLDQYDDLGGSLDNDHIDVESLQSGESEHVDSFYRDKSYRQRGNYCVMVWWINWVWFFWNDCLNVSSHLEVGWLLF